MDKTYIVNSATTDGKQATMRLYGVLGQKVDGDLFAQELASLDDLGLDQVNIRGNTPGGDVYQGMSIVSAIVSMRTPVVFHVDGIAGSMGAVIAVACDQVVMMDYARLMIHDPFHRGVDPDKLTLKQKKALSNCTEMLQMILSRRGKSIEDIANLTKTDSWFSATEAKAAGLCDKIVPSTKANLCNMDPLQLVAVIEAEYESNDNQMEKITLTAEATIALGLQNAAQEPQAVSAAIVKMQSDHAAALKKMSDEIDEFKKKQRDEQAAEASALIDAAVKEGRITADLKDEYLAMFGDNFARGKKILASLPGKSKLGDLAGKTGNSSMYADKSWDDLDKAGLLVSLKADDPELYEQKYKQMAATLKINR